MTRPDRWFQPHPLEGALFDYALYVGGAETHSGEDATRRDEAAHGAFVAARPPGGPWLMPLMEVGCVDIRKTSPRKTDLFRITASLLLSDRARNVLAPLAGEGVEFLPVEVTDGSRLWWTRAPRHSRSDGS